MRFLAILLAFWPVAGMAGDGAVLHGDAVRVALVSRVLQFKGGATQSFTQGGGTVYRNGSDSLGHLRVEGDQYCSVWPPSDRWTCYDIAQSADGAELRFISKDGSAVVGRYVSP